MASNGRTRQRSSRRRTTRTAAAFSCAVLFATAPASWVSAASSPSPSPSPTTASAAPSSVVAGLNAAAPTPVPAAVAAALAGPLGDATFGGRVGGLVLDATTGGVLWSSRPDEALPPASLTKLLTAAAALITLGPADQPVTQLLTTGSVTAGRLDGDLVLRGGGDVLLAADPTGAWPARATVDQLAAGLKATGVLAVDGRLVADGSYFAGPSIAASWDPTYVTGGSVAPVTALGVDEAGAATGKGDRSADPRREAAVAFRAALTRAGIAVSGTTVLADAPAGARVLASVAGTPVLAEVEEMLQNSDNDMAESLGRRIALKRGLPATFAGAGAAVKAAIDGLGIPTAGVSLVDASGLSHDDRVSPSTIAALLRIAAIPSDAGGNTALRPVLDGLAISAFEGTLAPRYRTAASVLGGGVVRAKTGALAGVSSLAGSVVDADGRQLLFVWISDAVRSRSSAEGALDAAATALSAL